MENDQVPGPIKDWVLQHAAAGKGRIYFRINGDIPVQEGAREVFFELPEKGKRVLVLHPCHLTPVAMLCYEHGITMIQII